MSRTTESRGHSKGSQLLNEKEVETCAVIVEAAKPSDQKNKGKKERKAKKRPGRHGGKAVPGKISKAKTNGNAATIEQTPAASSDNVAKPKKKFAHKPKATMKGDIIEDATNLANDTAKAMLRNNPVLVSPKHPALHAQLVIILQVNHPRICCLLPTLDLTSMMLVYTLHLHR
jgi:hypothetical protein